MIRELIFTGLGATALIKQRVEEEIKNLEKKGRLEDKKIKKELRGHLKELINELGLVTKKDLEKFKKEFKEEK